MRSKNTTRKMARRGMLITEAEQRKTKAEARNNAVKDK